MFCEWPKFPQKEVGPGSKPMVFTTTLYCHPLRARKHFHYIKKSFIITNLVPPVSLLQMGSLSPREGLRFSLLIYNSKSGWAGQGPHQGPPCPYALSALPQPAAPPAAHAVPLL